jgi:type IV fimbrial biogenesis protein FimT
MHQGFSRNLIAASLLGVYRKFFCLRQEIFMTLQELKRILSNNKGFTIGEMIAVAGVISVVMAIAVPNYLSFQPGMRLNGGARTVLGKLMWARSQAVEENASYVVTFPSNHTIQIFNDTNGNGSVDVGEWTETIDLQTDYPDVAFTVSGSSSTPTFNGRGTANSDTTVTITNSSGAKTVTVSPTGNVKIS